jgi:hypothetical protein
MATISVQAYVTIEEADAILGTTEPWIGATEDAKQAAINSGALYIDFNYQCVIDPSNIPDTTKEANALLANEDLIQSLWTRQDDNKGKISSEEVKAGSVSSKKSYAVNAGTTWKDPFPAITALLQYGGVCKLNKGDVVTSVVIRR